MKEDNSRKDSQLLRQLREGVGVVQMVFFKQLRENLKGKRPDLEKTELAMLTGAITNEVFGTRNPEERFVRFRQKNWGAIEQELLLIKTELAPLCTFLSDALRIQTLCDHQEGCDSSSTLLRAEELDYLVEDRDVPMPSTFMVAARELGKLHNLVIPPVEISPDQDESLVH